MEFTSVNAIFKNNGGEVPQDSLGRALNVGDIVLFMTYSSSIIFYTSYLAQVCLDENNHKILQDLNKNHAANIPYFYHYNYDNYVFKVSQSDIEGFMNYASDMLSAADWSMHSSQVSYVEMCRQYNYKTEHGSLRGLPMQEQLNRKLSPGDLVYYADGYKIRVGIVISDTHIFTEDLEKKRVYTVMLEGNPTIEEQQIRVKLGNTYLGSAKKKATGKGRAGDIYSFGDIYRTSKDVYIYLGRLDLELTPVKNSDIVADYQFDSNKEYWIVQRKDLDVSGLMSNPDGFTSFLRCVFVDAAFEERNYQVRPYLVLKYRQLVGFNHIIDKGPTRASYAGNLGISKKSYSWNVLHSFSCKLNIL